MPKLTLVYPTEAGQIVLRTEKDWQQDIGAQNVRDGGYWDFSIDLQDRHSLLFKPLLYSERGPLWSVGHNFRLRSGIDREIFPFFQAQSRGHIEKLTVGGRRLSVYLPAGYEENPLKRYPVLYMNDGQNLFEPVGNRDWKVDETLDSFHRWSQIRKFICVGIHHGGRHEDRVRDYAHPGSLAYARELVEVIKPALDQKFRTLGDRQATAIAGSSLGGLGALYAAWLYPQVFSMVACFSGAFPDFRHDFMRLVQERPKPDLRVYLDSGMAGVEYDGFDSTREVRALLLDRGFEPQRDLFYYSFPLDEHNESAWSTRLSLPLQLFFGDL